MQRARQPRLQTTMRCGALAALAFVTATLLGCATGSTNSVPPNPPAPLPASAAVSLCNQTPSGCQSATSFSLASMRDLSVTVQWSHIPEGTHTGTLEILNPGGSSYQIRNVSFAIAEGSEGSAQTTILVPVAGSAIEQRAFTGSWSVRLSLDGQPMGAQSFDFQP